jgi:hypothetical protein
MTQPSPHGYPDWGRYAASADKLIDTNVVGDIDAQTTYGPYFVGDIEWVNITFTAAAQHFRVRMSFRDSATAVTDMHNQEFVARSVSNSYLSFPVTGPWLFIRVTPSAINGSFGYTLTSARRGGNPVNASSQPNVLVSLVGTPIGAGATVTTVVAPTYPGPAIWNVAPAMASWAAAIETLDQAGAATRLDTMDQTVGKQSRAIYLPYEPAQLVMFNATGAASSFNAALLAVPLWPMVG